MPDLLERLEARATTPTTPNTNRGLNYNYPLAYYRRPDGDIVQLQSDPNNRAMYEDLGFVMLRPPEAREWEQDIRPGVILEQKTKARIITAIRRLERTIPQMVVVEDQLGSDDLLSDKTTDELQEIFDGYCEQFGVSEKARRLPAIKPEKVSAGGDARMSGVETAMSKEELEGKLMRGQGYDPTREAARRR